MAGWPDGSRALVDEAAVARLATVDEGGAPHVVPICFVVTGDRLYSVVDAKPKRHPRRLRRLRNIARNPAATVLIDRYEEDWSRLAWAMLRGRARIVDDDVEYERALSALRNKYVQYRSMAFRRADNPMIRLDVERISAWRAVAADSTE